MVVFLTNPDIVQVIITISRPCDLLTIERYFVVSIPNKNIQPVGDLRVLTSLITGAMRLGVLGIKASYKKHLSPVCEKCGVVYSNDQS